MEYDYNRAKAKEKEVIATISTYLQAINIPESESERISEIMTESSIKFTPPEKETFFIGLLEMNPSGRGGGKSTKPGNILLNIRKLMDALSANAFAMVSVYQFPWLAPFAFIQLWNSLCDMAEISITENDAAVIWTMWVHRDRQNNEISELNLLSKVNDHLAMYRRSPIGRGELDISINNLELIKCIMRSSNNPKNWWLCEWIAPTYK